MGLDSRFASSPKPYLDLNTFGSTKSNPNNRVYYTLVSVKPDLDCLGPS